MKAGDTIEIKGGIYFDPNAGWMYSGGFMFFSGPVTSFSNYSTVCEHTLTFTVPAGFDPRTEEIKMLTAEREAAQSSFAARVREINERIQKLMCIENSSEAS